MYRLHRCDGKTASTRIRRRTCHSQIETYDEFDSLRSCLLQLHRTRGGLRIDIKILGNLLRETIDQGNLRDRHNQVIQKRIMVYPVLLKSGKVELRSTIDRGNLRKISWDELQQVALQREEPLLGRNAHSARYGELIHDRTGKPVSVHHQEQADSEIFVME